MCHQRIIISKSFAVCPFAYVIIQHLNFSDEAGYLIYIKFYFANVRQHTGHSHNSIKVDKQIHTHI